MQIAPSLNDYHAPNVAGFVVLPTLIASPPSIFYASNPSCNSCAVSTNRQKTQITPLNSTNYINDNTLSSSITILPQIISCTQSDANPINTPYYS